MGITAPELAHPIEYNELKKLLELAKNADSITNIAEESQKQLTSPFWNWPHDAAGIQAISNNEWILKVFERKMRSEVTRVGYAIEEAHELTEKKKKEIDRLR